MSRYRIIEVKIKELIEYRIERRSWLFGWVTMGQQESCNDGLTFFEPYTFKSVEETEHYIRNGFSNTYYKVVKEISLDA